MTKHNPSPRPTHRPPKPPGSVVEGVPTPENNFSKRVCFTQPYRGATITICPDSPDPFQEYVLQERASYLNMLEEKVSLAIKPKPSWLTEKAWRWLLEQLLVMKHFRRINV